MKIILASKSPRRKELMNLLNVKYDIIVSDADETLEDGLSMEEQSKKLSENIELNNLDTIWSSSYTRAKATAKYIANTNNLSLNLDSNLNERKLGNLTELGEFMKDKKTVLDIKSPCLIKLVFRKNELIKLEQID